MIHIKNITKEGRLIKEDDRYTVTDVNTLNNMTVSETILKPGKATSGHHHDGLEEVYIFTSGNGLMILQEMDSDGEFKSETCRVYAVEAGDTICVPAGWFHKVDNTSNDDLVFTAIFQKYDR